MANLPKPVSCPQCGRKMAYLLKSIKCEGSKFSGYSAEWAYHPPVCPFCAGLTCSIEGCNQPSEEVFEHLFPSLNRAVQNVRNDYWACKEHASKLRVYRKLERRLFSFLIAGVSVGVLLCYLTFRLSTKSQTIMLFGVGILTTLIFIGVASFTSEGAKQVHLEKKKEYSFTLENGNKLDPGVGKHAGTIEGTPLCDYNSETTPANNLVCRAEEKKDVSEPEW